MLLFWMSYFESTAAEDLNAIAIGSYSLLIGLFCFLKWKDVKFTYFQWNIHFIWIDNLYHVEKQFAINDSKYETSIDTFSLFVP
jgi:hypothetical protein